MTLTEALEALKSYEDPTAVTVWSKLGMDVSSYRGADPGKVKKLAKKIGKDHALAVELWNTGIHEAKLLAVFIEDGTTVSEAQLEQWVSELTFWDLGDKFCEFVVSKSEHGAHLANRWQRSEDEFTRRSAFIGAGFLAKKNKKLPDRFFLHFLDKIENTVEVEMNWVKEGMIYALTNIGTRNRALNERALELCHNIGEVKVQYGATTAVVPVPISVLTAERIQAKLR